MEKKKNAFINGLLYENPTFVQLLGMCPTLATTTSVKNGIGMGLSATAVLILSNMLISLLRKVIPDKVRIAAYIVIIAAFVTIVEMCLNAYLPDIAEQLGIFIPLIVVNCIILARAESFASKNGVVGSMLDGAGMGLGFTCALAIISAVREFLGAGSIFGIKIYGDTITPMAIFGMPPGGFITLGIIIAVINAVILKRKAANSK
ncbi:MAG: electron transport complex subunit RsxE [Clostridia bacterium]|nr:electron transport complex subunit RsxE [Clostridia bacterium]